MNMIDIMKKKVNAINNSKNKLFCPWFPILLFIILDRGIKGIFVTQVTYTDRRFKQSKIKYLLFYLLSVLVQQ
jgi:hypothetical protein